MSWGHANVQGAACKKRCHELLKDPVPSPPLPVLLLDRWSRLVSTMVSHPSKYLIVGLSGKAIGDCVLPAMLLDRIASCGRPMALESLPTVRPVIYSCTYPLAVRLETYYLYRLKF